jgi:hypothetical protein
MASESGGKRRAVARGWYELEPPIAERMELEAWPRMSTVASFVFTQAAESAWEVLNQHLEAAQGGVFWIGGPSGCGKTHFLNYVVALQKRAGAPGAQTARRIVCGLELAGRIDSAEIESILLSVLAEQIGGDPRAADIFRQMRGAAALNVGLENASRMGVRAVTVAIDFGMSDCANAADLFALLTEVAASFRQVKFTVIAAGRSEAPASTHLLEVAPRDANEETMIAIRRARRLVEDAEAVADKMYAGIETAGLTPNAIFPFHPAALRALRTIAESSNRSTIVSISRLAREALSSSPADGGEFTARLIYPSDLTMNAAVSDQIKARLPESGRAAWKIAREAVARLDAYDRELAGEIVDTLVVEHCGSGAALSIEELKALVPAVASGATAEARATLAVADVIRRLEASTGGVIRLDGDIARFDPDAAGAPELAAFNAALVIARRFDPLLTIARDRDGLDERMRRLDAAMARAVEAAAHTREALLSVLKEANLPMPAANSDAIASYSELAEAGARALLEAVADRSKLAAAAQTIDAYEALAAAAAAIPRMRAMREYLAGTGLRALHDDGASSQGDFRESAVTALETECELLQVELGPRILTGPPRSLDALEARFQKFKWTYVQCYLSAHARWRDKMERLDLAVGDARRYFDALMRLNRISALGAPEGAHLGARVAELSERVIRCELGDAIAPETTPRCPSCGFQLGAASPQAGIDEAIEALRRALEIKLAALSQSVIARLIREHDREHRLEGFLKITQAAQTDALVRVLDEKLALYLAQVLDEGVAGKVVERSRRATIKSIKR